MRLVVRLGGGGVSERMLLERERRLLRDERVVERLGFVAGDGGGGGGAQGVMVVVMGMMLQASLSIV